MESKDNLDSFENPGLWDLDNTMLFDENVPASLPGVNFPDLFEGMGQQNIYPTLLRNNDFNCNPQTTTANSNFDFGVAIADSQRNDNPGMGNTPFVNQGMSNGPFSNQGVGYLPGQGRGFLAGQPAPQLSQNLPYFLHAGSPWPAQMPNQGPFPQIPQCTPGHVQQHAPPPAPQAVRGRTARGQVLKPTQRPVPQHGQPYTQPFVPQHGQQPGPQAITAEKLKQKLKEAGTDEFTLLIGNSEEAAQYQEVYLGMGDVDRKPREDIRGREGELIGRLYRTIRQFGPVDEDAGHDEGKPTTGAAGGGDDAATGPAQKKRKRAGARGQSDAAILRLSPVELELVCWKFLDALLAAQAGECKIPGWYTAKPSGYGKFDSFNHRFAAVEQILKDSKIMCKSLLDGDEWQARIAWNPVKEAQRKSSNKLINKERSVYLRAGTNAIRGKRNNEHEDEPKDVLKVDDDSELPLKTIKTCPDPESPFGDFDFSLSPMKPALTTQGPSFPPQAPSFPAQDPLFPAEDPSFPAANASSPALDASFPAMNPFLPARDAPSSLVQAPPWFPEAQVVGTADDGTAAVSGGHGGQETATAPLPSSAPPLGSTDDFFSSQDDFVGAY